MTFLAGGFSEQVILYRISAQLGPAVVTIIDSGCLKVKPPYAGSTVQPYATMPAAPSHIITTHTPPTCVLVVALHLLEEACSPLALLQLPLQVLHVAAHVL